jgi:hypothetical protein
MTLRKSTFLIPLVVLLFFAWHYLSVDSVKTNPELIDMNVGLNNNTPAYLSGCKTYQAPVVERKSVYPAMRKNFVTRLCALEVFPTNGIIASSKMKFEEKWMPLR